MLFPSGASMVCLTLTVLYPLSLPFLHFLARVLAHLLTLSLCPSLSLVRYLFCLSRVFSCLSCASRLSQSFSGGLSVFFSLCLPATACNVVPQRLRLETTYVMSPGDPSCTVGSTSIATAGQGFVGHKGEVYDVAVSSTVGCTCTVLPEAS